MGANRDRCSGVKASHLSFKIHEASGERSLPLGSLKPVDEPKAKPSLALRFYIPKSVGMLALRIPVSPPSGAMTVISP